MGGVPKEEGWRERSGDDGNYMQMKISMLGTMLGDRNFIFLVQGSRIKRGIKVNERVQVRGST